jgi:IS5 family transposase
VQEKAITFPTDAKLLARSRIRLVRLDKRLDARLCGSYPRVGKTALIMDQRYAHAEQFKCPNRLQGGSRGGGHG